jgi:hypothetical protein
MNTEYQACQWPFREFGAKEKSRHYPVGEVARACGLRSSIRWTRAGQWVVNVALVWPVAGLIDRLYSRCPLVAQVDARGWLRTGRAGPIGALASAKGRWAAGGPFSSVRAGLARLACVDARSWPPVLLDRVNMDRRSNMAATRAVHCGIAALRERSGREP